MNDEWIEIKKKWEEIFLIFNNRLLEEDINEIRIYIEHSELELAIEYLSGALYEYNRAITQEEYDKIASLGKQIGLKPYHWQLINGLVMKKDTSSHMKGVKPNNSEKI